MIAVSCLCTLRSLAVMALAEAEAIITSLALHMPYSSSNNSSNNKLHLKWLHKLKRRHKRKRLPCRRKVGDTRQTLHLLLQPLLPLRKCRPHMLRLP